MFLKMNYLFVLFVLIAPLKSAPAPVKEAQSSLVKKIILILTNEIQNISLFEPEPKFLKSVQTCPSELTHCNCPILLRSGLYSLLEWSKQVLQIPSALISSENTFSREDIPFPSKKEKRETNSTNPLNLPTNDEIEDEIWEMIQIVENVRKNFLKSFMDSMGYLSEVDKATNNNIIINNNVTIQGSLLDLIEPIMKNLIDQGKKNDRGWILAIIDNEHMNSDKSSCEIISAYKELAKQVDKETLLILAETCFKDKRGPFALYALGEEGGPFGQRVTSLPQMPEAIRELLKESISPPPLFLKPPRLDDDILIPEWNSGAMYQPAWELP